MFGSPLNIHRLMPFDESGQDVLAIVYTDVPDKGYITGFTYGLSRADAIGGSDANIELCLTVRSADHEWGMLPARMVAALRGRFAFSVGRAVSYFRTFAEETAMTDLVLAPPVLPQLSDGLVLGDESPRGDRPDLIRFIGVYPIYESERDFVYASGFNAFWQLTWDRLDPLRAAVL
jgi:hypothetical protein